tara:strand:- start:62619 stop:63671 length:1053 start_codon:yes stop_codon:yes gene_type:complete
MDRAVLIAIILVLSSPVGCLQVPTSSCEDSTCFPLNQDILNEVLSDPESFNVLNLATSESKLRVESSTTYATETQQGEITWVVAKDDNAQLRSIAMRLTLGTTSVDTEVIEGNSTTNVRLGNVWYEGRDAFPQYRDPFFDLSEQIQENPDGTWPTFGFDTTSISNFEWTITSDFVSQQQIATGTNDTQTVILEMMGVPPRIIGIEVYGNDDSTFILRVSTGDEVKVELKDNLTRTPIQFSFAQPFVNNNITYWSGYVPSTITSEIIPSELSFHGIVSENGVDSTVAELNLENISTNITDFNDNWWYLLWWDYSGDGLFSAGDYYEISTNSTNHVKARVFDHWANSWSDIS